MANRNYLLYDNINYGNKLLGHTQPVTYNSGQIDDCKINMRAYQSRKLNVMKSQFSKFGCLGWT